MGAVAILMIRWRRFQRLIILLSSFKFESRRNSDGMKHINGSDRLYMQTVYETYVIFENDRISRYAHSYFGTLC